MIETLTLEELRAFYADRDSLLFLLFAALGLVAWIGLSRLAMFERVVKDHCEATWGRWVEEDRVEQLARAYRWMGQCPRGHGRLVKGVCSRCGFK